MCVEIGKFERLKVYRLTGHPALILKISLPVIKDDEKSPFSAFFNGFYKELSASSEEGVGKWVKENNQNISENKSILRAVISFSDLTEEYLGRLGKRKTKGELLVIERRLSLPSRKGIFERVDVDVFDTGRGIILR